MRILYYNTAYHAGHGGSNHAREFFSAAARHSLVSSIELFPADPIVPTSQQQSGRLRCARSFLPRQIQLPLLLFFGGRSLHRQLLRKIQHDNIDVLIMRTNSYFMQIPRLRRRFPGLLIAAEINSSIFDENMHFAWPLDCYHRLEAWAFANSHIRIFVSAFLRDRICSFYPADDNNIVAPNGVDLRRFQSRLGQVEAKRKLGIDPKRPVIGYVGGMESFRRLPLLVEAFADLLQEQPDAVLFLVGDGHDMPLVKQWVDSLGLQVNQSVYLPGWLPHETIPTVLEAFDVAVFHASNPYGSPQKLFEYLAMRLPVVGPQAPAVTEVFEDGTHMLLTEPYRHEIAANLLKLTRNKELAQRLAAAGRTLVASKYTWDHNADAIITSLHTMRMKML